MAHFAGLVAAGEHPNPVEHAHVTTTTIHKTLCGPRSGMILCGEELQKDIDRSVFPGQQGGPLMHIIAAKAVALGIASSEPFRARQRQTIANAQAFADGLMANGVKVLTDGTDVHLVLVDLGPTGLDGKTAESRTEEVGITVNRNAIPFDERPADEPVGPPHRDSGAHDPRTGRGRPARDRRDHRRRAVGSLRGREGEPARAERGPDGEVPALSAALSNNRLGPFPLRLRGGTIAPSAPRKRRVTSEQEVPVQELWPRGKSVRRTVAAIGGAIALSGLFASAALAAPPANDNFANATTLSGSTASSSGTTAEATRENAGGEPDSCVGSDCPGFEGGHTVWYSWTAPFSGQATVDTCTASIDSVLAVYTGSALNGLTRWANGNNHADCGASFGSASTIAAALSRTRSRSTWWCGPRTTTS
jgi:hypothetical protein